MNVEKYQLNLALVEARMAELNIGSLKELSAKALIHRNTLYPMIRGERSPFSEVFLSICEALNLNPLSLIKTGHDSTTQEIFKIAQQACREFQNDASNIVFFLFGSRAKGTAKTFSDYDIGVSNGKSPLSSSLFLKLREFWHQSVDDFSVKVDVLNFDAAPKRFLNDFDSPLKFIAGSKESFSYIEGKIDGLSKI